MRQFCGLACGVLLCAQPAANDRAQELWVNVKKEVTGPKGDEYFKHSLQDALVPGGANGAEHFSAKLVVHTPNVDPDVLLLAVEADGVVDARIKLDAPLRGSMRAGSEISFSGVVKSYRKSPYELTFESEPWRIKGWKDQGPPRPNPE